MKEKNRKNRLPERLKQIRGSLSQSEFSSRFGFKQVTYGRWELGTREPDLDSILRICEVAGVSSDWLLGLSDDGPVSRNTAISSGHSVSAINSSVTTSPCDVEVERLRGEVAALERMVRMISGKGKEA